MLFECNHCFWKITYSFQICKFITPTHINDVSRKLIIKEHQWGWRKFNWIKLCKFNQLFFVKFRERVFWAQTLHTNEQLTICLIKTNIKFLKLHVHNCLKQFNAVMIPYCDRFIITSTFWFSTKEYIIH